jgi:hypothetical protein
MRSNSPHLQVTVERDIIVSKKINRLLVHKFKFYSTVTVKYRITAVSMAVPSRWGYPGLAAGATGGTG